MAPDNYSHPLSRCLSLDLEVGVLDERIFALAGVRADTGHSLSLSINRDDLNAALARLDDLSEGADFTLGHNLIDFDLPHLQVANPRLRLLRLPAVDTLRLNPLAFPRNPYHHLVKHYQDGQLRRGRINDPELEARLALEVFDNQRKALGAAAPDLLKAWHWLTTADNGEGFDMVFRSLRGLGRPTDAEGHQAIGTCLDGNGCRTHTREVVANSGRHGWSLAYALAWLSVSGGNSVIPPWVRHQFPEAGRLVRRLRDSACAEPSCGWCRERHDALDLLQCQQTSLPRSSKPFDPRSAANSRIALTPSGQNRTIVTRCRFAFPIISNTIRGLGQLVHQIQDNRVVGFDVGVKWLQDHLNVNFFRPNRDDEPGRLFLCVTYGPKYDSPKVLL